MMKRTLTILITAVFMLATVISITGCGSEPKTMEDYLDENPSAQQEIEDSLSGLENSDMGVSVSCEGNKIIITCEMKTTYENKVLDSIKSSYADYMTGLKEPMEEAVAGIEEETGISGVTIDVIVNNGDGSQIWKGSYPEAQEEAETEAEAEASEESK